ncbi:MATE family efflux transporter [Shewanella sp. AS16]|uniref:MATE family efflux transporter n=1 Tax=Shewanella sp. AS16 TaxID=2907625 RepID=UPI001F3E3D28|nr:MATE family efflux transporter [Shewanella sp. AS16]MCE9686106.1 MATE family efflux transporter [Shewanella sp. AS16]
MTWVALLFNRQKNRQLWTLALPMILSNITIPLLGLVDTAVIGHLNHAYFLGGVALGSTLITLIIWLLGFLRMATTGLVAQAYGANDTETQEQLLLQAAVLALALGLGILLLQQPLLNLALTLADASTQVEFYCRQYFQIRVWSLPFALLNLVLLGWLLGRQAPRAAMWQLIWANGANILLDLILVYSLDLGVRGAALASVMADLTAFAIAAYMVKHALDRGTGLDLKRLLQHFKFTAYGRLLRLNTDIFIRSLCLQAVFAFMTFKAAGLGDTLVAANAVLLNLLMLISYALDGIAYYAEAEVGRAYGRRDSRLLQESVTLGWCWSALAALGFSLAFVLGGEALIALLTDIDAVRQTAGQYLGWMQLMPLLAFGCYLFDGVYIGAAKGSIMRNSMMFSTLLVFFPGWYLLQAQGNHALWAAMCAFMLSRSLTLGWHYQRNKHSYFPAIP